MAGISVWVGANVGILLLAVAAVAVAALVLAVVLASRLRRIETHYKMLTQGADGSNLQGVLESHAESVRNAAQRATDLETRTLQMERASLSHLQRVGFLRFNPFRDAGGDQSFALVLADSEGNGVVISSLHGRDGARIYGKPIAGWASPYPLSDEERQAIEKAKSPA